MSPGFDLQGQKISNSNLNKSQHEEQEKINLMEYKSEKNNNYNYLEEINEVPSDHENSDSNLQPLQE